MKASSVKLALFLSALLAAAGGAGWFLQQPEPAPIRIGVLHSLTGTMAVSEKPLVDAARLAVEEINASGGLLGRKLEMRIVDGRSNWAVFAAEAERLIVEEKVSALFGCWTSACRKAVKPVVERYQHVLFYPVQYEGLEQSPNIVYTGSVLNQQIIPGLGWALERLGKRVYLLGSDYIFPRTANQVMRDLIKVSGAVVLNERYLPLGADDFKAVVEDLRRLQPDVILNTINGDSNLHFFRALRREGLLHIPVLSFSVAEGELQALGPEAYHPLHYAVWSYFQSLPDAANLRFVMAFKARFGQSRVTSDPIEASYNGVRLWASAARDAESDAPEAVNRAILRQTLPGPSGIVAVNRATRHLWKWMRWAMRERTANSIWFTPQK
jgi:urea transport system substrate-binding protein